MSVVFLFVENVIEQRENRKFVDDVKFIDVFDIILLDFVD